MKDADVQLLQNKYLIALDQSTCITLNIILQV